MFSSNIYLSNRQLKTREGSGGGGGGGLVKNYSLGTLPTAVSIQLQFAIKGICSQELSIYLSITHFEASKKLKIHSKARL